MERRDFVKTGLAGAAVGLMSSSVGNAQDHQHASKKQPIMPVMSDELTSVAETAHASPGVCRELATLEHR
jgi:hypothetical protein